MITTATAGPASSRLRPRGPADPGAVLAWSLAAVFAAGYATLSIRRHQQMRTTGFDLGIFEQAIRSYAEGGPGLVPLKGPGFIQLGDHFSPILLAVVPFYRAFPSPVTLLVVQAVLLAVAVVPLTRLAHRRAGVSAALVVGAGYGLSWGVAQTVGFDFHEVCFAVPMLAWSLTALVERRPGAAACWAAPMVLVKEDLGLTVAAVGLLIAARGRPRTGWGLAVAGAISTLVSMAVILPALNTGHVYGYTASVGTRSATLFAGAKADTIVALLAPTAFVALRSPVILVALPTLAWRFLSGNPLYWGTGFHYSAVLMPVVFVAFADGLPSLPSLGMRRVALLTSAAVTLAMIPGHPLAQLAKPRTGQADARPATARQMLRLIPGAATVAASNNLVPQIAGRTTVTLFGFGVADRAPDFIAVDTATVQFPLSAADQRRLLGAAEAHGYARIFARDGFVLLRASAA